MKMMRARKNLQGPTGTHQLELWGSFPPRADNGNDPFASRPPQPVVRKLTRLEVRRAGELLAALEARSHGNTSRK